MSKYPSYGEMMRFRSLRKQMNDLKLILRDLPSFRSESIIRSNGKRTRATFSNVVEETALKRNELVEEWNRVETEYCRLLTKLRQDVMDSDADHTTKCAVIMTQLFMVSPGKAKRLLEISRVSDVERMVDEYMNAVKAAEGE